MKNFVIGSVCAGLAISISAALLPGNVLVQIPGPPMICQPFDIGTANSIGRSADMKDYDKRNLVKDTLDALNAKAPVIVRMETLRRVSVVGYNELPMVRELMLRLTARALDAEASAKASAIAWFDAGYLAASLSQMGTELGFDPGRDAGCDGYLWLKRAASLAKDDAEIEFAAALATHPAMHKGTQEIYEGHLRNATKFAAKGSLAEKNIREHCTNWKVSPEKLSGKADAKK